MDNASNTSANDLTSLTSDIVSAYVSHNVVQSGSLPELISAVHASLSGLGAPNASIEPETKATSAEIRKSIKPDGLVSFIDGKSYKTLKRHLSRYDLTAETYRTKFGLPHDYPMVAASYAAHRSQLAKSLGLGQLRRKRAITKIADGSATKTVTAAVTKRTGRAKKAAA